MGVRVVVDGWEGVRVAVLLWWVGVRDTIVAVLACWVKVLLAFLHASTASSEVMEGAEGM